MTKLERVLKKKESHLEARHKKSDLVPALIGLATQLLELLGELASLEVLKATDTLLETLRKTLPRCSVIRGAHQHQWKTPAKKAPT
jgi:hypothetical protein